MAKFFITTAIPYVNDKPHIGTTMEFVLADARARYHRMQGEEVLFSTGTDEHGGKILDKAKSAGLEPKAYTDAISTNFKEASQALGIAYDKFVRTTDPEHIKAAQHFWRQIAGDIYKGKYKGWYCTGCERFFTEQEAKDNHNVCPIHQIRLENLEEENYFFKLSKYSADIKQAITLDKLWVMPQHRKHEILALLEEGLEDISFSRPKAKIPWGIEVPGDRNHVMYVWVEALINYLTAAGYPKAGYEKWWSPDVQVIGKDILRFHAAIWPAMLMAAKLPLPRAIYVHGFITVEGKKISKSLGNIVDPIAAARAFGTDALRYYLLHEIPNDDDGDFSWKRLEEVYNNDLANDLGNLIQRTAAMINQYQKGVIGEIPPHSHDVKNYHLAVEHFKLSEAMDEVWTLIRGLNQYIDEQKPWQLAKEEDREHLTEVLGYLVSNLLQVATLLTPFLPETASKIEQTFAGGVVNSKIGLLFPKQEVAARTNAAG